MRGSGYLRGTLEERFHSKYIAVPEAGCWLWLGTVTHEGYGKIWVSDAAYKPLAHRVSWELHHGPIPAGMNVCHKCDTRSCVNPCHLFIGTQADNMRDMISKGRKALPTWAVLTHDDVRAIRNDDRRIVVIALDYGVNPETISQAKQRKTWRNVA